MRQNIRLVLIIACVWVAAGLVAVGGCGDGRPTRVPVSGQVLIDGQPMKFGFVRFLPANARSSGGNLDSNGRFALTCFEPMDGATLGVHKIEVVGSEPLSPTQTQWHAPKKYASFATSDLQQEIKEPTDSVVINLTWGGGKPFVETDESGATESLGARKKK